MPTRAITTPAVPLAYSDDAGCASRRAVKPVVRRRHAWPLAGTASASMAPTRCMLLIATATSFNGFDKSPAPTAAIRARWSSGHWSRRATATWDDCSDARRRPSRLLMRPGGPSTLGNWRAADAADRRADRHARARPTRSWSRCCSQYGRYLLIASSRPGHAAGEPPGHLERRGPAAVELELDDQHQHPDELLAGGDRPTWPSCTNRCSISSRTSRSTARSTAATNYGAAGWVAHHNSDLWRQTAPVGDYGDGDPVWALWPMARSVAVAAPLGALRLRRRRRPTCATTRTRS